MDKRRVVLAVVLSVAVFIAWAWFFGPKPAPPTKTDQTSAVKESGVEAGKAETAAPVEGATPAPASEPGLETAATEVPSEEMRTVTVDTDLYVATFTESGGRLKSLKLKDYRTAITADSPFQELVTVERITDLPLGVYFRNESPPRLKTAYFKADTYEINLTGRDQAILAMTHTGADGLTVVKTYTFKKGTYLIDLKVALENRGDRTIDDQLVLEIASNPIARKERYTGFGAVLDGKVVDEVVPKDLFDKLNDYKGRDYTVQWAAYEDQYFMAAVLPGDQTGTRIDAEPFEQAGIELRFLSPPLVMKPQTQKEYSFQIFYGPKDYSTLKEMENGLVRAINFGWLDWLSKPLLWLMAWMYGYVGNFGVVIIIVTIIIKLLFWPLTAKSYKSMKGMQKLQPMMTKIREKYKDDREAMNREMMNLYRTYKVNPLGGCLPMVIQIPVFISFYKLLDYSLELRHAPFAWWIQDLSAPDRLFATTAFSVPLMEQPVGIPILTLLMGASMLLQQKMTPMPGDPTQAKIMMFMPIFFTFIFINFPAGLVLYWLTNNILSIGQQTWINKRPS